MMGAQAATALPLLASVVLYLGSPWLGRRLPPRTAVRLLTAATLVTALGAGFTLGVAGFVLMAQVPWIAMLGHWSPAVVASGETLPDAPAAVAAVTVTVLLAASIRRAVVAGVDLVRAALVCRRLGPSVAGLVVVEDDVPDAYALPGVGGRVVVSTAMLRALSAGERQVLLAHEAAHLTGRHHVYVQLAELAAAANPLLRPVAAAVELAVERWADEVAAEQVGDRELAARALARAGLARAAATRAGLGRATATRPGPAVALAAADAEVAHRARALLAAPPRPRPALAGALAALMLATVGAVAVTAHDTESRFERAEVAYTAAP
jgi:Zn-dependent protease with chaperone function